MTTMRGQSLTLGILVAICFAPGRAQSQDAPAWREIRYRESFQTFPNPERGFYAPRMSNRIGRLDGLRERGITLLLVEVDLKAFKERDLTQEKLDEVRQAFAAVRQHGLKAIVRFAYGFTGRDYRSDPKDMDRILGHIRQLGKVFQENRDVLYGVQAGFLGPWGEWHGSNWGDPPSLQARRSVLFGLLDAVPEPITVHVRRPMFIRDIFAGEPGGELTEATAYGGSRLSRVGWHDDALLSLPTDMGTYAQIAVGTASASFGGVPITAVSRPSAARRSPHRLARRSHRSFANWSCSTRPTSTAATTGEHSTVGGRRRIGAAPASSTLSAGSDTALWRTACVSRRRPTPAGRSASSWTCATSASPRRTCRARWPSCSARGIGPIASPSRTPTLAAGPRRPAPSRCGVQCRYQPMPAAADGGWPCNSRTPRRA